MKDKRLELEVGMKLQHATRCGKASSVGLDGRRETGIGYRSQKFWAKKSPAEAGLRVSYGMKLISCRS